MYDHDYREIHEFLDILDDVRFILSILRDASDAR